MNTWESQLEHRPVWTLFKLAVAATLCIAALVAIGFVIRIVFYPAQQAQRIVEKTLDADNVIYNYEYFKQAAQDIRAYDAKLAQAREAVAAFVSSAGPRERWDFRDKEEHARLSTNVTGLQAVRADMAAQYNARSQMANRSIFKTGELPERID